MTRRRTTAGFLLAVVALVATASSVLAQQQTPRIRAGGERRIQAVLTKRVAPVYPKEARTKRIRGTVVVEIVIGTDGRVIEPCPSSTMPPWRR
jgi:outer membrane biosynthesis protein TonB